MLIEAMHLSIWLDFSLNLTSDLDFHTSGIYHLQGPNGSGKSSFINQSLLPAILSLNYRYVLYFEQQMHIQIQMVKANSALIRPHSEIKTERDTVNYLLRSLLSAQENQPRPCYVVMDESLYERQILDYVQIHIPSCCLIYTSHDESMKATQKIIFEPVSQRLSKVYVNQG